MRLFHLSDLHIGKIVNTYQMLEDQKYILNCIIREVKDKKADGVIIAGDLYDIPTPSIGAVQLFDSFISELSRLGVKVYIVSGNHDSEERVAFGSELMSSSGVYMAKPYSGSIHKVTDNSEEVPVNIYLLPYIKPRSVRGIEGFTDVDSYDSAMRMVLDREVINPDEMNILVAHQFVTGASTCESEERTIGGIENIDSDAFDKFDYVALGHIHGPQYIGKNRPGDKGVVIRYSGTPLKYSFSETAHKKSITVIDIEGKSFSISEIPLVPLHDMAELRGTFEEIMRDDFRTEVMTDDYVKIILTDEQEIPDVKRLLDRKYSQIMSVFYDNSRTRAESVIDNTSGVSKENPIEYISDLYSEQNGMSLDEEQLKFCTDILVELTEGNV